MVKRPRSLFRWLRDPVLRFAVAVTVAGAVTLVAAAWLGAFAPMLHPPALLVAFIVLSVALEGVNVRLPSRDDIRVSASSLPAFSALAMYGTGPSLFAFGLAAAIYDVRRGAAPIKTAFNVGQYMLSVGAAGAVLGLAGHAPAAWAAAGAAHLLVNIGLTARVTSMAMAIPFVSQVRAALPGMLCDAALVAYVPIVCVAARTNGLLLVLVALPFLALYWSGREADRRRHEALHDALTGLPNRVLFARRLHQELQRAPHREGGRVDVVLFDLDGFKEVNDALGHGHGDDVLRHVAERLSLTAGDAELVARLGGDEFGAILLDSETPDLVARGLRSAVEEPLVQGDLRLRVTASAGVARWPEHGDDADTLQRHADVAMYRAKTERTNVELYDPAEDPHGPERLELLAELRDGIPRGELVVHYQPKLSLASGRVEGAEALVRWQHPEKGLLYPGAFVELAERSDLMPALSAAVLEISLAQVAEWRAQGLELAVAVNVPPEALHDFSMPSDVEAALARHGLDGSALVLEITESSLMRDALRASEILEALCALGVRVAIDDFGTGYSSLAWLRRLPVHEVKIDRSFVMEMDERASDAAIVQSTVQLGQTLGLSVVAEGVETESALARLREFGCDYAQGFLISKPVPADKLTEWLHERAAPRLRAA